MVERRVSDHRPIQRQNKLIKKEMNLNCTAMIEKWCFKDNRGHEIMLHNKLM